MSYVARPVNPEIVAAERFSSSTEDPAQDSRGRTYPTKVCEQAFRKKVGMDCTTDHVDC